MKNNKPTTAMERNQINKNKKSKQEELDKHVEAAIDKAFGRYPNVFKRVK